MKLPLGQFTPDVKLGLVSASRNCFPRSLSEKRMNALLERCKTAGLDLFVPEGECAVIESKAHAADAAKQMREAGVDAAVLFLGNFSPEIEDAAFIKAFDGPAMVIAAAEESADNLAKNRGDALCGLLSATMAISKRGLKQKVHLPENPIVDANSGALEIAHFLAIMQVVKGISNCTIGLFGPRPRDFETCNYNVSSLLSIGVEVEEHGFFDLANAVEAAAQTADLEGTAKSMRETLPGLPEGKFTERLSAYEHALLQFREELNLSGATTQCWSEQEFKLKHVPCAVNARLASLGFPVACENDAYSLTAELMGQYASGSGVTILDINHSIPIDLAPELAKIPNRDVVGLFHCGNTDPKRLKQPEIKHQVIMKSLMEPDGEPDITRGTLEGQIDASPITVLQVHGAGDKLQAYIIEGEFLDLDPKTFGATGTAYLPGFGRFYRHVLLGRFHHHAAVAFDHCGAALYDAMKMLGIETIHTPLPESQRYPGENPFMG
jgi:L-fucose isomerase-like protein